MPVSSVWIETDRLVLRRPVAADAAVRHELWTERDPRVPPHRRLGPDGRPTVDDLAAAIRAERPEPDCGLLTVVRTHERDVIGYCGLVVDDGDAAGEPELAYELVRRCHGHGYATEAARAVLDWAAEAGHRRVRAGVRTWNDASLRVLDKLGFVDTGQRRADAQHGDSLTLVRPLPDRDRRAGDGDTVGRW